MEAHATLNRFIVVPIISKSTVVEKQAGVEITQYQDNVESGRKAIYIIFEILTYFVLGPGIPALILWLMKLSWPFVILGGVLGFSWPVVKGSYAEAVRKLKLKKVSNAKNIIRSSSFWYDGFLFYGSKLLRIVRRYASLSRSLDLIYNYFGRFNVEPKDMTARERQRDSPFNPIKLHEKFWFGMPVAQDVRSRLSLVSKEIQLIIKELYEKKGEEVIKILSLAGGTQQDLIMAIAEALKTCPKIRLEIVCVEPDKFGVNRSKELREIFKVPEAFFRKPIMKMVHSKSGISLGKNKVSQVLAEVLNDQGYKFVDFDLTICIGLGDYMYEKYGQNFTNFLQSINNGNYLLTGNVSNNFIERFFLHYFIQWPAMQYLSLEQYQSILLSVFAKRKIKIIQTPHKIFNVTVIEP